MEQAAIIKAIEQEIQLIISTYYAAISEGKKVDKVGRMVTQLHISTNEQYCKTAITAYEAALAKLKEMKDN